MRFIDAPIATAMNVFATTPPVSVVSTKVNAFSIVLIRALENLSKSNFLLLFGLRTGIAAYMSKLCLIKLSNVRFLN